MSLEMSVEEREAFLADLHVGVVSIARKAKGPLTVPIWYDYEPGGDVWMVMSSASLKGKLLANTDRISLCAQSEQAPYSYVSVEGPFSIAARSDDQILHMATRYLGEELGRQYAAASEGGDDSIVVAITPESWYTVDYNKR
jgi:nitroimidazol reductase NimA-like FMN-containing flavoprotein (pyridoxamine 5'-phosphate oxidase superfamily)